MDILVMAIVGFTAISLIVLAIGKWNENRRRRFLAIFGKVAPRKGACPEEMNLLRRICRQVVGRNLAAATESLVARQSSVSIETIRSLFECEQQDRSNAVRAFRLAKSFGLVPRGENTPESFAGLKVSEI